MPKGPWDLNNVPTLAGVYNRFVTRALETVKGGNHGIVAMPVKANWGEVGKVVEISGTTALADLKDAFGDDMSYTAYKLGRLALLGKPEKLLLYRMADSDASYGTLTLQNKSSADSIKLQTKYKSSRKFNLTISENMIDSDCVDIALYEENKKLYKVEQVTNTVKDIVENINLNFGSYLSAEKLEAATDSDLISECTNSNFINGNDGCTKVESTQYDDALSEFAKSKIDVITLDGVSDRSIQMAVKDWIAGLKEVGSDVIAFFGGDSTVAECNTASLNFQDTSVFNVAIGGVYEGVTYTPAETAVYVAALFAGLPLSESLCYRETIFEDVTEKLDKKQLLECNNKGSLCLIKEDGVVKVFDDKNTFTNFTKEKGEIFGEGRCQRFINVVNQDTLVEGTKFIGKMVGDDSDEFNILCALKRYFETLQKNKLVTDFTVEKDESVSSELAKDDAFFWKWDAQYVRVKKRIFGTGYLR